LPQHSLASPIGRAWNSISHHPLWSAVIAGLIVAVIVGLVHSFGSGGIPSPGSSGSTSPSTVLSTGSPTASSPGPSSRDSSSPSASSTATTSIYYQGPVTISGNGLDFDISPPRHGPATANFVYNTSALEGAGSNTVGFAIWKQSGTPTASECSTFVTTNPASVVINVAAGMKICFKTDQGRVGLLSVQPDTTPNELHGIATIWTPEV
jgi:hypothetical protein